MKSIVSINPDKIENLSDENKDTMIEQTINAAKNQNENKDDESDDLTDVIADIIVEADAGTSGKLIQKLDKTELKKDSDLNLSILEKLSTKDLYEEKLEIISTRSRLNENSIEKFISKSIENAESEEKLEKITKIIDKSESIVIENVIKSGEKKEGNKKKVVKIISKVIEKNPEKAIEIFDKNKKTKKISNIIKTKIEKGDAINVEDFDKVFDVNISPN